jgi:hypothetical protein
MWFAWEAPQSVNGTSSSREPSPFEQAMMIKKMELASLHETKVMELARLHEMKVMELKTQQETKMMELSRVFLIVVTAMLIFSNSVKDGGLLGKSFNSLLKDLVLGYSQVKSSPIVKAFLATSFASSLSTLLSNLVGAIVVAKGLLAR